MSDYDVIIMGAGAVGLSCALALAKQSFKVALVESREFQPSVAGVHRRVSALNLASSQWLQALGVWPIMPEADKSVFRKIEVWDGSGIGKVNFNCEDIAQPMLGHIVTNDALLQALWQQTEQQNNIDILCPANAEQFAVSATEVTLQLSNRDLSAKLLVGADGAFSWVRQQAKFGVSERDYQHHAMIATIKFERGHRQTARQVFLPKGPLALLPLREPRTVSIVWSSEPEHIEQLSQLMVEDFLHQLSQASDYVLGDATAMLDQPMVYPLTMRHADHYCQERIALIGDAAHTLHPLAGQGVNLGMRDAQQLVQVMADTVARERDIGRLQNLRRYERARIGDNRLMMAAMQGFKSLFGSQLPLVCELRNTGLALTDQLPLLKNLFMQHATGL